MTATSGTSEYPVTVYTAAQSLGTREEGQSAASPSGESFEGYRHVSSVVTTSWLRSANQCSLTYRFGDAHSLC